MTIHSRHPDTGAATAPSVARDDRDVYRLTPTMDDAVLDMIAARLEFRGDDAGFARLSQAYFRRLPLAQARRILALGCGTGVEVRALGRITGQGTTVVGVDHSPALLDAARRHTADEGLADRVTYEIGDAHQVAYGDAEFDIVTLHTLVSHVDDPLRVLQEAGRVVRPAGTVAVFDGDYASMTFGYPDHAVAKTLEETLTRLIVANPRVMRDMPRLLKAAGLDLVDAEGTLYADIGGSRFWLGAAESYGGLLGRSGLLPEAVVEEWRAFLGRSAGECTFFGASNYYTYLARRPG